MVGINRLPSLEDRSQLHFTNAVMYEIQRYQNESNEGLPRLMTQDTKFRGVTIPQVQWPIRCQGMGKGRELFYTDLFIYCMHFFSPNDIILYLASIHLVLVSSFSLTQCYYIYFKKSSSFSLPSRRQAVHLWGLIHWWVSPEGIPGVIVTYPCSLQYLWGCHFLFLCCFLKWFFFLIYGPGQGSMGQECRILL